MKRFLLLGFIGVCAASCATWRPEKAVVASSACDALHSPWRNPQNALVIDAYEKNAIDWDKLATAARVAGVIHRATCGLTADNSYAARRIAAKRRRLLWGSYHVGTTNDPIQQADFYLRTIHDARGEVMALDLEDVVGGTSMNIAQAQLFLGRVHEKTGRYPLVYANQQTIFAIQRTCGRSNVFARTRLWYARYTNLADISVSTWRNYTLWQFASELRHGPQPASAFFPIPGTSPDIDVNVFNGTLAELRSAWPFADAQHAP